MASKKFILRIETSRGRKRLTFTSPQVPFSTLQSEISTAYGVKPEEQILSRRPPSNPDFIEAPSNNSSLSSMGLKHGDLIYLVMGKNHLSNFMQQEKQSKEAAQESLKKNANVPTSNNNNNSNSSSSGMELDGKEEEKSGSTKTSNYQLPASRTRKIPTKVTLETSEWVNDPKHKIQDLGPKHIPFHKWIEDRQKKYSNQPWNIDPPKFDYRSVPYNGNVAFKDLPPNAVIKRQEYRHCDVLIFKDPSPWKRLKSLWAQDSSFQRAAYLIGNYKIEPNTLPNKSKDYSDTLLYANVYALYVPPQKGHMRGVKLLKDPNEESVDRIIKACGFERVGWMITTLPRGGKEYHGDIFMSGDEIYTAARLQEKYKNQNTGYSKFVSLITHIGTKEPQAFQISDQGVAMIRYGLVAPDNDPGFLKVSKPPERVYVPSVINENTEIKPEKTFLPDAMLVNVIATQSSNEEHKFNFVHFPSNGKLEDLRNHLTFHKDKEYHVSLSDFSLLCFLPRVINVDLACKVAQAVVNKKRLDSQTRNELHKAFQSLRLV